MFDIVLILNIEKDLSEMVKAISHAWLDSAKDFRFPTARPFSVLALLIASPASCCRISVHSR